MTVRASFEDEYSELHQVMVELQNMMTGNSLN